MSSSTTVVTTTSVPMTFSLSLADTEKESLRGILERYPESEWNELFSEDLRSWIIESLAVDSADDKISAIARSRLNFLLHDILVNPMDGSPLIEPVLVGAHVWEYWAFEEFKKVFNEDPLEGGPWQEALPHLFAQEILKWTLPILSKLQTSSALSKKTTTQSQLNHANMEALTACPDLKAMMCSGFIERARLHEGQRVLNIQSRKKDELLTRSQKEHDDEVQELEEVLLGLEESLKEELQKIREDNAKKEAEHTAKLDEMQQSSQQNLLALQEERQKDIALQEELRKKDKKIGDAHLAEAERIGKERIKEFQATLRAKQIEQNQLQQNIITTNNTIITVTESHAANNLILERRAASADQQHATLDRDFTELHKKHLQEERKVRTLEASNASLTSEVEALRVSVNLLVSK
ncbi:MAG: hypothetical protein P4L16_07585 [Chlamydiales bacterium]|nr:hypothetical protein [Chlamydiales bacterium]